MLSAPCPLVRISPSGYSSSRDAQIGFYQGDRIGEGVAPGVYFLRAEKEDQKPVRVVKVR